MIYREQVLKFLKEKQETEGGYTGNDLTILAGLLKVTPRGLRKRLSGWIKNDKEFSQFIFLGKEKPSETLFEFFKIEQELSPEIQGFIDYTPKRSFSFKSNFSIISFCSFVIIDC